MKAIMRRMISAKMLLLCIELIGRCLSREEFLFDSKILLFSDDTTNKILLDRKLVFGFKTNQKTYDNGWIDGVRQRWVRSEKEVDISSVRMLSVPSDYFGGLEVFFSLAGIPRYAEHMQMPLESFVDILWALLHFHMIPNALVLKEYLGESPEKTMISCFKENLYLLIRNTPSLRHSIQSIISEIHRIPQSHNHTPPSIHTTPWDKVVWFLQQKEHQDIMMFLEICVWGSLNNTAIYTEVIEDLDVKDSVRLVITNLSVRNRAEDDLIPFSEFILRNTLRNIQNMNISIEGKSILSEDMFSYIFIIFPSVKNLALDHPEGHIHTEECTSLLTNLLMAEEKRIALGIPSLIQGLVLSHTLFLSDENIPYLENSNLHKFGFKSYYPATYPSEDVYKKIKPHIDRFLDRLFLGNTNLSHKLIHMVAPEIFFFSQTEHPGLLANLRIVEIHMQNEAWQETHLQSHFNMSATEGITTAILVEESDHTKKERSIKVLAGLSSLKNITHLDLTKASIPTDSIIHILEDVKTSYKRRLHSLAFTYNLNVTPSRISTPLWALSRTLPSITNYKISLSHTAKNSLLPSLIKDIKRTLTKDSRDARGIGMNLFLRTIRKERTKYSTIFKMAPYAPSREALQSAYKAAGLAFSSGPNIYELMLLFNAASKYKSTPKNSR